METKNKLRMLKIIGVVGFNLICLFSIIYVIPMSMEKRQAIGEEADVKVIKDFEGPKKTPEPTQVKVQQTTQVQQTPQQVQKPAQVQQPPQQAQEAKPAQITTPAPSPLPSGERVRVRGEVFLIDNFTGDEIKNRIGSRANVYTRAPSRIMISRRDDVINGEKKKVLMIKYDKKNSGGPNGMGGWCGYYTIIKDEKTGQYFDGTGYKYMTFWVKGEKGDENFMAGLADEHWDKIGDSLKAEEIGVYLEKKKITTEWQKAKVPLEVFFLDHATLSSISINFEADCFPEGAGAGVVYIADIALEK